MSEKVAVERIKDMTIFIAVNHNDEIIGTIGWKRVNREEGHIRGMAVHPSYQGKESPATDLLKMVEKDARSQGCNFLTLDTTEVLERAQNFYRKNGFTKTGKTGDFFGATIFEFKKMLSDE